MGIIEDILSASRPDLTVTQLSQFRAYYTLLELGNQVMNLTAISGEQNVATLHFLDSLIIDEAAELEGKKVIDIGSGAGFPGIPLKIAHPEIELTLLDALTKRVNFMHSVCEQIGIEAVTIHGRAEELSREQDYREKYDYAVSRAVANLNMLCELCVPFIKVGGELIAMKGIDCNDEIDAAGNCIRKLGCELAGVWGYVIPETEVAHQLIVVRKVRHTPDAYPRRFAKIQKEPL